jgi:DNA-binding CsgD family transcriptional regulator
MAMDSRVQPDAWGALELGGLEPETLVALALVVLAQFLARPYLVRFLARSNPPFTLTRREIEVLGWVAGGKTNAETAKLLSIAPGTVKKHLDHIYEKLGVGTRTEAVVRAMRFIPSARERVYTPRAKAKADLR